MATSLASGCDGCHQASTPGAAKEASKTSGATAQAHGKLAPPKNSQDEKVPLRGPDPAPLNYPVRVKAGERVWTYNPNDATDNQQQQFTQRHEDKAQVLGLLPLKEGMVVADVGCGAGYFTPDLARLVGAPGKVYALDIKRELIKNLEARLQKKPTLDPHKVIVPRVSALDDIGLPAASVDVAFLAHLDFYLHNPLPAALARFMKSCQRAVRKNGRLVILQWMQVPSQYMSGNGQTASYSKRNLLDNLASVGFVKEAEHDIRSPRNKNDKTKLFVFRPGKGP